MFFARILIKYWYKLRVKVKFTFEMQFDDDLCCPAEHNERQVDERGVRRWRIETVLRTRTGLQRPQEDRWVCQYVHNTYYLPCLRSMFHFVHEHYAYFQVRFYSSQQRYWCFVSCFTRLNRRSYFNAVYEFSDVWIFKKRMLMIDHVINIFIYLYYRNISDNLLLEILFIQSSKEFRSDFEIL